VRRCAVHKNKFVYNCNTVKGFYFDLKNVLRDIWPDAAMGETIQIISMRTRFKALRGIVTFVAVLKDCERSSDESEQGYRRSK
jgi:hypothetical protein